MYPAFGNLSPRDVSSRAARTQIESGHGVGPLQNSVYLDFRDALARLGRPTIAERYGNLFEMYHDATGEDPYTVPMRIAPGRALLDGRTVERLRPDDFHPRAFRRR